MHNLITPFAHQSWLPMMCRQQ